jgi:multidrug transporter EmrE-like cation transporter
MIPWPVFSMVLVSVACSAAAQLSMKHGMAQQVVQQAIALGDWGVVARTVILNVAVLGGLALYGLSATIWLFVLAKLDVSVAYPFVALGFLVTMGLGCLLFGEALTSRKLVGTIFVMFGVYLVAAGK